jgi:hypothetical protein
LLAKDSIDSAMCSSNFVGFLGARVRFTPFGEKFLWGFCGDRLWIPIVMISHRELEYKVGFSKNSGIRVQKSRRREKGEQLQSSSSCLSIQELACGFIPLPPELQPHGPTGLKY